MVKPFMGLQGQPICPILLKVMKFYNYLRKHLIEDSHLQWAEVLLRVLIIRLSGMAFTTKRPQVVGLQVLAIPTPLT
jgi:hypothetical protein